MTTKSDYPTCLETYATLRVFHDSLSPHEVTVVLGLQPKEIQTAGETWVDGSGAKRTVNLNGWFLSTEGRVNSKDNEKHLAWLVKKLSPKAKGLSELLRRGYRADICCMWDSKDGHGGPTLSPALMKTLATLGVPLWFDVYFQGFVPTNY